MYRILGAVGPLPGHISTHSPFPSIHCPSQPSQKESDKRPFNWYHDNEAQNLTPKKLPPPYISPT